MNSGAYTTAIAMLLLPVAATNAQTTNADYHKKPGSVNEQVVDFVQDRMGKKVGRGECWDLAAEALNSAGATWDGSYGWGVVVDPGKDSILPGDVIQFKDVELEWVEGNSRNRMTMPHHTAVVVEVKAPGVFIIAHQNFGPIGRKVGTTELVLAHVKKGRTTFYRPQG